MESSIISQMKKTLKDFRRSGHLIEARAYHTVHGLWTYFTADDGQVHLEEADYLGIGTLESFQKMKKYYGESCVVPIYIEVENGERLTRALKREKKTGSSQVRGNVPEISGG